MYLENPIVAAFLYHVIMRTSFKWSKSIQLKSNITSLKKALEKNIKSRINLDKLTFDCHGNPRGVHISDYTMSLNTLLYSSSYFFLMLTFMPKCSYFITRLEKSSAQLCVLCVPTVPQACSTGIKNEIKLFALDKILGLQILYWHFPLNSRLLLLLLHSPVLFQQQRAFGNTLSHKWEYSFS